MSVCLPDWFVLYSVIRYRPNSIQWLEFQMFCTYNTQPACIPTRACFMQVLKHLYRQLVRKGLRMICVITKVDLVDEEVSEDVACVQTSLIIHMVRQCVSQTTGLPMNQVLLQIISATDAYVTLRAILPSYPL
jgi:hypothetical protein